MNVNKWLKANKVSGQQFAIAQGMLMTGPKSTPPSWRAIRKMIGLLRNKRVGQADSGTRRSWRTYRSV